MAQIKIESVRSTYERSHPRDIIWDRRLVKGGMSLSVEQPLPVKALTFSGSGEERPLKNNYYRQWVMIQINYITFIIAILEED